MHTCICMNIYLSFWVWVIRLRMIFFLLLWFTWKFSWFYFFKSCVILHREIYHTYFFSVEGHLMVIAKILSTLFHRCGESEQPCLVLYVSGILGLAYTDCVHAVISIMTSYLRLTYFIRRYYFLVVILLAMTCMHFKPQFYNDSLTLRGRAHCVCSI